MLSLEVIKSKLSENKQRLYSRYGLSNIAVFESYARNQQTDDSDIDILVEFNKPLGVEFVDLAQELEQILSIKVDLLSKRGLKESHYKTIEKDLYYA